MRAGEHQREALVGNFGCACGGRFEFVVDHLQMPGLLLASAPTPCGVDCLAARDAQEPRFRILRNALRGPIGKRGREGLSKRIFRSRDIARARRKIRDQLAIAAARDVFGGIARCTFAHYCIGQIGRTSIVPIAAPGHLAAQESAASRSGTSIR